MNKYKSLKIGLVYFFISGVLNAEPVLDSFQRDVNPNFGPKIIIAANSISKGEGQKLVEKTVAEINKIMNSQISNQDKLNALVSLNEEFTYKVLRLENPDIQYLRSPQYKSQLSYMQEQRLKLLRLIEPQLLMSIKSAKSVVDLASPLVLNEGDNIDVIGRIKKAQNNRLQELTAFKPVSNASQLKVSSFTAKGLNQENILTAIYLGDFNYAHEYGSDNTFAGIFTQYLHANSKYCHEYLPSNKVPMTERKCTREVTTTTSNAFGPIASSTDCSNWIDHPTGFDADPVLYESRNRLLHRILNKAQKNAISNAVRGNLYLLNYDLESAHNEISDPSIKSDLYSLVQKNQCHNAGLKRFEKNLHLLVEGSKQPLLLPDKVNMKNLQLVYQKKEKRDDANYERDTKDITQKCLRNRNADSPWKKIYCPCLGKEMAKENYYKNNKDTILKALGAASWLPFWKQSIPGIKKQLSSDFSERVSDCYEENLEY
ncbi:MAG: hypothetical protein KUF72_10115 [Candidatus Thiodiazotropha sp. (ex Ctena orbiculata)]|nr:hypothetical protein [Candidatus Thiodiazotropha taylori]